MTISYLQDYINYCDSECGLSQHTLLAYQCDLKQFFNFFDSKIDKRLFERYTQWLSQQGYQSKTLLRKMSTIKSFIQFCVRESYCEDGFLLYLKPIKKTYRLPNILDKKMIESYMGLFHESSWEDLRDHVLFELLYSTGIRVSECVNLRFNDIDLEVGSLFVLGKGNKQRYIPLTAVCQKLLKRYFSHQDTVGPWVFQHRNKKRLSRFFIYGLIKKYTQKIDKTKSFSVSPHSFRHAFATHLIEGGAGIREVQLLLGHQQLASTQIYTQVSKKYIKQTFNQAHPRASL